MTVSHQVTESLIFENRDLRIDQRHRLFSPIRRFDESDVETRTTIWPRLETALRFHRTHNKANSPGPAVEDQINIARLFAAGYTYSEIMYTYGLTHLVKVRASYRNVNQLLLGILSQEEKAMLGIPESVRPSERYSEILEIHDAYSMLPGVIQSLREDSSPYVRQLIKRNPHFEYLILMLAQGYGFRDLAEMWGIDKYSKQGICHLRISYRNRFLHGRESATTGHKFLRNLVFAKFLATKERWSGYDPYDNLTGLFREVSNYPDRSSTYVGGLQHILSLIVLLHFKTMINEESRNPDDLAAVFPGIDPLRIDPNDIDIQEYMDVCEQHKVLPPPMLEIMSMAAQGLGSADIGSNLWIRLGRECGLSLSRMGVITSYLMDVLEDILLTHLHSRWNYEKARGKKRRSSQKDILELLNIVTARTISHRYTTG